jgi:polysaccharide biosynthesis/export protein
MFNPADGDVLQQHVKAAESNYVIQKNDLLRLEVYTNLGEKIIDPNLESFGPTAGQNQPGTSETYLVDINGMAKLPLINEIRLESLTLKQAEEVLQKEYAKFYREPFIRLMYTNKRVTVLGTPGGQVIPLANENTRLTEVLALAKGLGNAAKAHNIRVLRGDKVFIADLSTIAGYLKSDMIMMPGDIVYVEPVHRPISEGLREYGPVISIITSVATLVIVILQSNK